MTAQMRGRLGLLFPALFLLSIQSLPYFQHRWVEDESWYSMPAVTLLQTGELRNPALPATDSESHVDTRPPLMPLSIAAAFRLIGVSATAARLGQFLAALLTLLVVYAIGRECGDPLAGGVAALILSADNFFVISSRTARPEVWVALMGACGLSLLLRSQNTRSWRTAFLAGVVVALGCLFHVHGLGIFLGLSIVLLLQERNNLFRSPRSYAYVAGFCLAMLPFLVWLALTPEHLTAAAHMYGKGGGRTIAEMLAKEESRLLDLLGVSNQRLHLPIPVPLRLHIVLAFTAAFAVLWRSRRPLFWMLLAVIASELLWFVYLPNETARYYAVIAPLLALSAGLAVSALSDTKWKHLGIAIAVLCVISQLAGTAIFLNQARKADYPALSTRLREVVPAGHSCYAAMAFQLALFDRQCHSYDRTPFAYTVTVQRPEYMVLGDRVMMRGSGFGHDDYADARSGSFAFVARHGSLVARIDDDFYGDLQIYRVNYDGNDDGSRKRATAPAGPAVHP